MTDKYDASIPHHRKIAHGIELGNGIPEMRKTENARNALKTVGFEMMHDEDLADRGDEIVCAPLSSSQGFWLMCLDSLGTTRLREISANVRPSGMLSQCSA